MLPAAPAYGRQGEFSTARLWGWPKHQEAMVVVARTAGGAVSRLVQLVSFEVQGHSLEWNAASARWEASLVEFLRSKIGDWNLAYSS